MLNMCHAASFLVRQSASARSVLYASRNLSLGAISRGEAASSSSSSAEEAPYEASSAAPGPPPAGSRRTGVLGVKLGMMRAFDDATGAGYGVTVVQLRDCQVVQQRTMEKDGYTALQVGAINVPDRKVTRQLKGHFESVNVPPKRQLKEFRVTEDCLLPPGTELTCQHFTVGQEVDVIGRTIGKGFQGVMKKHGFKGMRASHGVTKTHRRPGAMGGGQDPGRVWPGKKLPGRMGTEKVMAKSLVVDRIDPRYNLLFLRGCVPGHKETLLEVADTRKKPRALKYVPKVVARARAKQ